MDCDEHISDSHTDSPIHLKETIFRCGVCMDEFKTYQDALGCEAIHAEGNDIAYQNYKHQQEIDNLIQAGNHPAQKKLVIE
jgi:hypothetical protein